MKSMKSRLPMAIILGTAWFLAVAFPTGSLAASDGTIALKKLLSWNLSATDSIALEIGGEKVRFFPQSFAIEGNRLIFLNRHDPSMVSYSLETLAPERLLRLKHEKDKKFSASFFIDLALTPEGLFGLEQSTGTLRRIGEDGAITDVFRATKTIGAIIVRTWRIGENRFAFLDKGKKRLLLRDISDRNLNKNPDRNGRAIDIGKALPACNTHGFTGLVKKPDGSWEVFFQSLTEQRRVAIANWSAASVFPLDCDDSGFYFYLDDDKRPRVVRITEKAGQFSCRAYSSPRMSFSGRVTRLARIGGEDRLLVLLYKDKELSLQEALLKD